MSKESNVRDEAYIGRLIGDAYSRLPEPESSRLDAVEGRLLRALPRRETKPGPVNWYWWLIAAVAASAAAAWWAGEYFRGEPRQDEPRQQEVVPQGSAPMDAPRREAPPAPARATSEKSPDVESPVRTNRRPLIYRQER